jgi:HD-GYP domain-containing protein (c-di-GMP phosphodiesterase class II)
MISQAVASEVSALVEGTKKRSEDALVDGGYLDEATLLKGLSSAYRVHFVSTEKLARLEVPKATLQTVPRRVAELFCVFPVSFDGDTRELRVVTPDPDETSMLAEIQELSGAREVKAFVARPAAVAACIRKHHAGEVGAFAGLGPVGVSASFDAQVLLPDGRLAPPAASVSPAPAQVQSRTPADPVPRSAPAGRRELEPPERPHATPSTSASTSTVDARVTAALEVAATLADASRGELRGHSSVVALLVRRMGELRGLPADELVALYSAGLVHDFGKPNEVHVTALSCTREHVQRTVAAVATYPSRLVERVALPDSALASVLHMYERWDGRGAPHGLAGDDIPKGATLLAVADTYADLVKNPDNPYGRLLSPAEALGVMSRAAGTIFSPEAVSTLAHALREPSLIERIHALVSARKTGRLELLNAANERAEVWFLDGALVHAVCTNAASAGLELVGTPAFFAALALADAEATFDPASTPKQRSIVDGTTDLLAEAARRRR